MHPLKGRLTSRLTDWLLESKTPRRPGYTYESDVCQKFTFYQKQHQNNRLVFPKSPKKTYCLIFKFHLKLPYLILQSQGTAVAGIDTVATGIVSFRAAGGAGAAGAAGGAARLPETATPLEGSTVARKDSGSKRNI